MNDDLDFRFKLIAWFISIMYFLGLDCKGKIVILLSKDFNVRDTIVKYVII